MEMKLFVEIAMNPLGVRNVVTTLGREVLLIRD